MRYFLLCVIMCILAGGANAQKKVLTTDDFAHWKQLRSRQISNDGNIVAYELNEQKGDGNLIIFQNEKNQTDTLHYGYKARFSPNSDFIIYHIKPDYDTVRQAKLKKVKKEKLPKDSLGIFHFAKDSIFTFPKVKSYKVAKENSSWLALYLEHAKEPKDTSAQDSTEAKVEKPKKNKKAGRLLIKNLDKNLEFEYQNVTSYEMAKNGEALAFITDPADSTKLKTIQYFNTNTLKLDTILRDSCKLKSLTLDNTGQQLAFLYSKDTVSPENYSVYLTQFSKKGKTITIDTLYPNMPKGYTPGEHGSVYFSDDATKLFFGVAPLADQSKNDSILDEEIPNLDIWHWQDIQLQPMQKKNLKKDQNRTYLTLLRLDNWKLINISSEEFPHSQLFNKKNSEYALIGTDKPYLRATSWTGDWWSDVYRVDLKTGDRKLITKEKKGVSLHPEGQYAVWFNYADSNYYAKDLKKDKVYNLTESLPYVLCDELNDMPTKSNPYGVAGWGADKKTVYVYDRYDVWMLDLSGKTSPICITKGFGREQKIRLRYMKLDSELVYLPETDLYLDGIQEGTIQGGYYKLASLAPQKPQTIMQGDYSTGSVNKAKNANQIIWSISNLKDFPEVRLSGLDFKNEKVISKANPQQEDYNWATVEKIEWTSFTGEKLEGLLYKPENFDPNKKYPVMLYFYERNVETMHRHYYPYPSHSTINRTFYCSNGYLVFVPDITYKTGYPGQSAYNAIVSGAQSLIERYPFVDKDNLAISGQSWGGYQTAYLITQTDMFKAAMAGAPVSNMTSAYGGIRWGSGMSRMFQYEHTQSRIGGTLWEKPMQYIENSPVFYVPKVNTPLLIMHNDEDGAVPWYQGIELFVAMRRCNKPAWMLNYNGMPHNLSPSAWWNRVDLSKRMMQFFDHYLKGSPAPEWMEKGIPATEKGKNLGY